MDKRSFSEFLPLNDKTDVLITDMWKMTLSPDREHLLPSLGLRFSVTIEREMNHIRVFCCSDYRTPGYHAASFNIDLDDITALPYTRCKMMLMMVLLVPEEDRDRRSNDEDICLAALRMVAEVHGSMQRVIPQWMFDELRRLNE